MILSYGSLQLLIVWPTNMFVKVAQGSFCKKNQNFCRVSHRCDVSNVLFNCLCSSVNHDK